MSEERGLQVAAGGVGVSAGADPVSEERGLQVAARGVMSSLSQHSRRLFCASIRPRILREVSNLQRLHLT